MSTPKNASITLTDVGLNWPDGTSALAGINGTFATGRTGLVGTNGSGKTTLLRLIAGQLEPTSGSIRASGTIDYLPQVLTLRTGSTIADLLGINGKLAAIAAIESGDVAESHFDVVGNDWDIEGRADATLHGLGFSSADLHRSVKAISGGEAMLVAIAGLRLRGAPITLLDEPTNNLDRESRAKLANLLNSWPGALVVVSHDITLLDLMDDTAELHDGQLTVFGGRYSQWRAHLDQEQSAAVQAARAAKQVVKTEKRNRLDAESKIARSAQTGKKKRENKVAAKIVMNQWASNAQVSAGKLRSDSDGKVKTAQSALDSADARVRDDAHIHVDLPDPGVPNSRRIAELHGADRSFIIQGPERVAIIGPNGVGKTTLLETLVNGTAAVPGRAYAVMSTDRFGYLPQRLDDLDDSANAIDNVIAVATSATSGEVRNQLARFLLRGPSVERAVGTLSGGERFRVAIARLLLADPPPQLLVLDEPTNNLDLQSTDQLVEALRSYRGALIIVSHDDAFLSRLGLTKTLELDESGGLAEISTSKQ